MVNKTLLFMVLFVSAVFLVSILGGCSAQPVDNTRTNTGDTFRGGMTTDQRGQTNEARENISGDTSRREMTAGRQADNTGINMRDTSERELTADQQSQTSEDREISQKIRQAIVDDESLSTYAHNVKIITVDGMVTLKGPVRSEDEKRIVEEKAIQIAGRGKVNSEIGIALKNLDN